MKFVLNLLFVFCFFIMPSLANIQDIETELTNELKTASSNSYMITCTRNAIIKLEEETITLNKELKNFLTSKQKEILDKNTKLWLRFTEGSKESTIRILRSKQGTINHLYAVSALYDQMQTRALTLYYLLPNSQIVLEDFIWKNPSKSKNVKSLYESIEQYNNLIKNDITELSQILTSEDYKKILIAQSLWKDFIEQTQKDLYNIIDKSNYNKELKKAQILYMYYQIRHTELSNLLS